MSEAAHSEEFNEHNMSSVVEFELIIPGDGIKTEAEGDEMEEEEFYLSNDVIDNADQSGTCHQNSSKQKSASDLECYICHKVLANKSNRDLHIRRIHGSDTPAFECDLCGVKVRDLTKSHCHEKSPYVKVLK